MQRNDLSKKRESRNQTQSQTHEVIVVQCSTALISTTQVPTWDFHYNPLQMNYNQIIYGSYSPTLLVLQLAYQHNHFTMPILGLSTNYQA